ncbi:DUF4142 domain-containing protein [Aliifodinibius sp. S!AR15-10]|uniref:DUF4142 domain-containing protein n=1 Tax=Aliifodinibius sp. S!AR15-10 TaxID=2950437 RepID=UPI00285F2C47|nr:DUF4142 domain-containing protein [Aliifodinibius sp. S!AR15-10]MDR8389560.1 DUF4142 domain-containing protein [Aliifodinibius sp. S!AR15-10]
MKTLTKPALLVLTVAFLTGMSLWVPQEQEDNTMLDDMEIAHIAYTAGTIDISYAHLALAFSKDPAIREFAETMIRDHTAVNEQALALLNRLSATPKENPTSQQLLDDADQFKKKLVQLDGKAFDRLYAKNELDYHRFVNKTVETQFIPAVQNQEFKDLLRSALATFKVHEQHAKKINEKLR